MVNAGHAYHFVSSIDNAAHPQALQQARKLRGEAAANIELMCFSAMFRSDYEDCVGCRNSIAKIGHVLGACETVTVV